MTRAPLQMAGAALVGAAVGVGGTLVVQHVTTPDPDDITSAINSYVTALNNADTATLGNESCGLLKRDYDRSQPQQIHAQLTQAVQQRGPANVTDYRNVSIDGDRATAAGVVTYAKGGRTQENLTIYGLKRAENTWKLCWSEQVSSYDHTK